MRILPAFLVGLVMASIGSPAAAQSSPATPNANAQLPPRTDNPLRDRIDSAVHRAAVGMFSRTRVVGMSIGVGTPSGTRTYDYGTLSLPSGPLPTAATPYAIGSITKTFAATLLAQAAAEGRLGLDDDIRRHLPGDYPNLSHAGQPIRLRHLITHLSGLPRNLPDSGAASSGTLRQRLLAELHRVALDTMPGARFAYSNVAAQLLGVILEDTYRQPLAQLFEERITRPLRMTSTGIARSANDRTPMAVGYDSTATPVDASRFAALQAAGALTSTVTDMLAYLDFHAAERDSAARITHRPVLSMGAYAVGLNWQMMTGGGGRTIWQDGGLPGYTSLAAFSPELGLRVVLLTTAHDYTNGLSVVASDILTALDARAVRLP
jgi:CubicO group peptidase (beta-lactamase class C family)